MAKGRMRLEWDQSSLLWCALVNPHRDPQEHPEPFTPADVHPLLEKPEESGEPDWGLWHRITQNAKVHTIDMRKLQGAIN